MVRMTRGRLVAFATAVGIGGGLTVASGEILTEDFNTVTGSPGAALLMGSGFNQVANFDDGIAGENAFFGTVNNTQATASVAGNATAGVGGSGAVEFDVSDVTFNVLSENLDNASGTGGGVFLAGDPNGPNDPIFNFTLDFDDGLGNDRAFGGTFGGAILNGTMSASGTTTGGVGGTGGAVLDVDDVNVGPGGWYAGLEFVTASFPGVIAAANTGFEDNGGSLDGWAVFSAGFNVNAENTNFGSPSVIPRTGDALLKVFGQFNGSPNNSGVYQDLPAQPGQTYELSAYVRHNADDAVQPGNVLSIQIEYYDGVGTQLQVDTLPVLDANAPLNVWTQGGPVVSTAPAGTTTVRPVIIFFQPLFEGGAAHIDDISLRLTGGPNPVDLADFAISADVRGIADAGGETLGDVQVRLEDPDGNRLRFTAAAGSSFANIGGALDTAVEANADDVPTVGAFNRIAPEYRLVVAFDNAGGNPWGTGGTLEVDNLLVSNSDPNASGWFGGIFFDDIAITEGDFGTLALTADVKGDVVGGAYELRLEGFSVTNAGIDESFDNATLTGGVTFLDPNGGPGFTNNWDDGIDGESAFGGIGTNSSIFSGGGFTAQALNDPNAGQIGEIRVENVILGIGEDWFAGLAWGNQGLASTDLSQVTLSADIRGQIASGGSLGTYELRLEDAQGDRMFFQGTANGSFQSVGGTLDTATEGAALSGSGDGTFDLDSTSYTVAISFIDPGNTWGGGGVLQVDNVFLTPVTLQQEVGRVTFEGVANGSFQTIGGLLSSGISTYGDYENDLNGVTGTTNVIWDPNVGGGSDFIDAGLDWFGPTNAFAGTFGGVLGTVTGDGCTSCGVGGTGAVRLSWDSSGAQGWFFGVSWTNVPLDLSGDLSQVELRADIKGTGSSLGAYVLRIEDADLDLLEFIEVADGTFQSVGGPLSTAGLGSIPGSDGSFNFLQETYSVVLVLTEPLDVGGPDWGTTGGEVILDNLFATGVDFTAADRHTVTVAFRDELNTWGTDGTLTVDNISFGVGGTPCPGDTDGDNDVDLSDLATVLGNFGSGPGATLAQGDVDGNGFVDLSDLALVLAEFGNTCP